MGFAASVASLPEIIEQRQILPGDPGSVQTLGLMRRLSNNAAVHPLTIATVKKVVPSDGRNRHAQARAISEWLYRHVLFFRDPAGVEYLYDPVFVLQTVARRGFFQDDCDDYATLAAAMGKAAGMRARFVVMKFFSERAPMAHVYTELQTERGWYPIDRRSSMPFPERLVAYRGIAEV